MRWCLFFHRWTRWRTEFEEMPDGCAGVYEFRSRDCVKCGLIEEESRCVSSSPEVVRGLIR